MQQQQDALREQYAVSAHRNSSSSGTSIHLHHIYAAGNSYFEGQADGAAHEHSGDAFNDTSIQLSMGSSSAVPSRDASSSAAAHARDPAMALFASATPAPGSVMRGFYGSASLGSEAHRVQPEGQLFSVSPAPAARAPHAAATAAAATAAAATVAVAGAGTGAGAAAAADNGTLDGAAAASGRRVSFGPTARLSFSGAFEASSPVRPQPPAPPLPPSQQQVHQPPQLPQQSQLPSQPTGGRLQGDEQPHKMQKMAAEDANSATNPSGARVGLRQSAFSPFAIESSPIAPATAASLSIAQLPVGPKPADGIAAPGGGSGSCGSNSSSSSSAGSSSRMAAAEGGVNHVLAIFAAAYQHLCLYRCRECIETLQQLPRVHFHSALVSQWVGKAYYEMNEYQPAMMAFREMLKAEPFRIKGMETLSTALWHLKLDRELSALAQQVVEVDRFAPETWCVVGNCFSLQKEPDSAVKFFHRALQIDSRFTYAHTLCGHEQVSNEDMDKAIESFRQALLTNDRHYNAWYGLGSIYYRQERYELAEFHFRQALQLNPASSVLHCYLGEERPAAASAAFLPATTHYELLLLFKPNDCEMSDSV